MSRAPGAWLPRLVGWVLIPALGVALRLAPLWQPPGNTWTFDAAGHYRLVAEQVAHGHLPTPDRFTDLPEGRRLGRFLPPGFYRVAGTWHRIAAALGARDLDLNLQVLMALLGALVAWPVWGAARALGAHRWAAAFAALVAVLAPAHLQRTTAFLLRYEGLGTLLATAHIALAAAALGARTTRSALARSMLSALALVAALATWRVTLVVPALETAIVFALAVARPPTMGLRIWTTTQALGLAAAALLLEYLRAQSFLLSPMFLATLAVAATIQTPILQGTGSRVVARAVTLSLAVLAATLVGLRWGSSGDYETVGTLLRLRLSGAGSTPSTGLDPITAVMMSVQEFRVTDPLALVGPGMFSWLGGWLVVAPIVRWVGRSSSPRARTVWASDAFLLVLGLTLGLVGLTLLITRHRVLLAPLVAVLAGAALAALTPTANPDAAPATVTSGANRRGARRDARGGSGEPGRPSMMVRLSLAALGLCTMVLGWDAVRFATTDRQALEPGWVAALGWMRDHAPAGAPVLSVWERGYEIQLYGQRPTVVDGLLESPVNQAHLVASAHAFLARTPDSLAAFCERLGVEIVVVPPSRSLFGVAVAAGNPLIRRLIARQPLSPEEADRVLIRMMLTGSREPPFEPVFERDGYRIYRLEGGRGVTTSPAAAILPASSSQTHTTGHPGRDR
jgi:asparagine N-glycosylation enzyme membrane subunit Stt3